jgi:hypothetical protein
MTHDYKAALDDLEWMEKERWVNLYEESIRAALELADRMQWHPIEDAPKDGSWVLLAWRNSAKRYGIPAPAYWHVNAQMWTDIDPAKTPSNTPFDDQTHFMPLPQPPEENER